jgi:uncharacterized protein YkwD
LRDGKRNFVASAPTSVRYSEMPWALLLSFAMLTGDPGPSIAQTALPSAVAQHKQPTPKLISASIHPSNPTPGLLGAPAMPSPTEDYDAENELLARANESRQRAGVPPLRMEKSLTGAAHAHARMMVERQQLSHQFDSEPGLLERLLEAGLRLDRAAENVAFNSSAEKANAALMLSAPHRQNLLNPQYNATGVAAFWSNGRLYVVEDFAHKVPELMPTSAK